MSQKPHVAYPKNADGGQAIDDDACFAVQLGLVFIDGIIDPAMGGKIDYQLYKGEDDDPMWAHPPYLALYGLDGKLYPYMVFMPQFKDDSCLVPVKAAQAVARVEIGRNDDLASISSGTGNPF